MENANLYAKEAIISLIDNKGSVHAQNVLTIALIVMKKADVLLVKIHRTDKWIIKRTDASL